MGNQKHAAKKQFIGDFTTLMQESLYQAIMTKKIYQIYFDLDNRYITAKHKDTSLNKETTHQQFTPDENISKIIIPEQLVIRNFFIQKEDEFSTGKAMHDVWFYIMPDGTSQSIIINIEEQELNDVSNNLFALSINPFYSQVTEYETFQTP